MDMKGKPGAPRVTHPESTYIKKYGEEAGKWVYAYKMSGKLKTLPWTKAYNNIVGRCTGSANKNQHYKALGVRVMVKPKDLRAAFFRDKAYQMEIPSVDRIDPDGHYEASNVRWMEFSQNRVEKDLNHPKRSEEYDELVKAILPALKKFGWRKRIAVLAFSKIIRDNYEGDYSRLDYPVVI